MTSSMPSTSSPQFQRFPPASPLVGSSSQFFTAPQNRDQDALSDISAFSAARSARSGRSIMSVVSNAAGQAKRTADVAGTKMSKMWHRTQAFFRSSRTALPRAVRTVPLASMGMGSHDDEASSRARQGHVTVTSDGRQIPWQPTHLWRTSLYEYRACQVLEWTSEHATIVDTTGVYSVAHSDVQVLQAEGGAPRAQARRPQSTFPQSPSPEVEARMPRGDQASWRSSSSEHAWGEATDLVGVSSLSVHVARQVAARVDRQVEQMSAHILRALIGQRNMFLWADEDNTGRFLPVKLLRLVQLHTSPKVQVRVNPDHVETVDIGAVYKHSSRHVRMELLMFERSAWPPSIIPDLRRLINDGDAGVGFEGVRGEETEAPIYARGGGLNFSPSVVPAPSSHSSTPPHGAQQISPETSPPDGEGRTASPSSSPPGGPPIMTSVTEPISVQQGNGFRGMPKFDPTKIRPYTGSNCIGDRSKYEDRPLPWCRQFIRCAQPQGIREESYVVCALLCVTTEIASRYEQEQMRPADAPTAVRWERWAKDYPPNPSSLLFDNFVGWLCSTFHNPANVEAQRTRYERCVQKPGQSVFDFNTAWNWERELLAELTASCYAQPDASVVSEGFQDSARDRQKYMGALLPNIRREVHTWHSMCKLQPLVHSMPYMSNPLETMATRSRLQGAGNEPSLQALQECALSVEQQLCLRSAFDRYDGQVGHSGSGGGGGGGGRGSGWQGSARVSTFPRSRLLTAPTRMPPRTAVPPRIQALEWVPGEGEDAGEVLQHLQQDGLIDDADMLFNHLQQSGRIPWSKAQMRKLFDENRCFKCTKQGHQKSDCRNPAADPKAFHALEVEDQPLEHDEQLFHLLTEFVPGNDSGADSQ